MTSNWVWSVIITKRYDIKYDSQVQTNFKLGINTVWYHLWSCDLGSNFHITSIQDKKTMIHNCLYYNIMLKFSWPDFDIYIFWLWSLSIISYRTCAFSFLASPFWVGLCTGNIIMSSIFGQVAITLHAPLILHNITDE